MEEAWVSNLYLVRSKEPSELVGLKLIKSGRDSFSAFLAASVAQRLVFMIDGQIRVLFFACSPLQTPLISFSFFIKHLVSNLTLKLCCELAFFYPLS